MNVNENIDVKPGQDRRQFLHYLSTGIGSMAMLELLHNSAKAEEKKAPGTPPAVAGFPNLPVKAKRVIAHAA